MAETVQCTRHGNRERAFVCGHLLRGTHLGFFTGEVDASNPHPDAWCSDCEAIRISHGGWEQVEHGIYHNKIDVRVVCSECYQEVKAKNESNNSPKIRSLEMDEEQFRAFRHATYHELMELNSACEGEFRIGHWERWDYDADAGTIIFSETGIQKVIAEVQLVGTTSAKSNTWLWGWANSSVPRARTVQIERVRAFGEAESLPMLTEPSWPDDEYHGWEMTAIAAKLIHGKGGYRGVSVILCKRPQGG